jgi:hypothetical protein
MSEVTPRELIRRDIRQMLIGIEEDTLELNQVVTTLVGIAWKLLDLDEESQQPPLITITNPPYNPWQPHLGGWYPSYGEPPQDLFKITLTNTTTTATLPEYINMIDTPGYQGIPQDEEEDGDEEDEMVPSPL